MGAVRGTNVTLRVIAARAPIDVDLYLLPCALARATAVTALLSTAIAGLYLVKSALGIDLIPGPSPLHDLLYPLVRG
jgi:hypothetical protein